MLDQYPVVEVLLYYSAAAADAAAATVVDPAVAAWHLDQFLTPLALFVDVIVVGDNCHSLPLSDLCTLAGPDQDLQEVHVRSLVEHL